MVQSSSWEANNHLANQEIPRLWLNPKVHYHVHKTPPLDPTLRQLHPVHTLPFYFHKIRSNIIFPSTPRSSKWTLTIRLSKKIECICHRTHACYIPFPSHPPFYYPNAIWWSVQIVNFLIIHSSPSSRHFSSAPCSQRRYMHIEFWLGEGKRSLGRSIRSSIYGIESDLTWLICERGEGMQLVQGPVRWRSVVLAVSSLQNLPS
jgi:hypothetical protein